MPLISALLHEAQQMEGTVTLKNLTKSVAHVLRRELRFVNIQSK